MEASLSQPSIQTTAIKRITRKQVKVGLFPFCWPLILILALQAVVALATLQNTAFQDEGLYLYAGQQMWLHWLHGLPLLEDYSSYFSGNPYVYPIIGGALDMLGGLELARFFSLVCMLIVTVCGYYVTKQLFDQKSAVFAAIFYVCQGPVLFLSRLATFDALCLCLLAVATALAVNASLAKRPWRLVGIGPLLVLAFGAKYAALLFIPSVLGILALCVLLKRGWISMLARGMLGLLSLALVGTLAAILVIRFDPTMLHALSASTTNRIVFAEAPRLPLAEHVIQMVGLSYAVGLAGLLFARKKHVLVACLFLGSALLIPAYHIYKAEPTSLDKHLGYSMFFAMPVAGYALASLSGFRQEFSPGRNWLPGMALCLILFLVGTGEAQFMYSSWPSAANVAYELKTQARPASGHYLAESRDVLRYYLKDDTYTWQWTSLYFFEYTDNQSHYYVGDQAYVKAVNDGYFDLIELDYQSSALPLALLVANTIEHSQKYDLIDVIPSHDSYGTGHFFIYRKR